MVTSLSDLCSRMTGTASLVVQGDRRQTPDRRKARRGGRRTDDINLTIDPVDMRSVAIRRTVTSSHFSTISPLDDTSRGDTRYAVTRSADLTGRRLSVGAGHRAPK